MTDKLTSTRNAVHYFDAEATVQAEMQTEQDKTENFTLA